MKKFILLLLSLSVLALSSCTENYSNGDRVGQVTKFSKKGLFLDTWEGELVMTQSGNNGAGVFEFSIDRDNKPDGLVDKIDSAIQNGSIVRLTYHQVKGLNWFQNRGEMDYFITDCVILSTGKISTLEYKDGSQNSFMGENVSENVDAPSEVQRK